MALLTTGSAGLSGQYQKWFDPQLLKHAKQRLVLAQFGQKKNLPKNKGSKVIRFTRPDVADASQVLSTAEGIATPTFRDYTLTFIDATLLQYDEACKISDVLNWTDLFSTLKLETQVMAEDFALHADGKIRDQLVADVTGTGNRRYVGATQTFAGLQALTQTTGVLTITDILDGMTRLEITRAPYYNGEYVLVVGPQVARDILNDPKVVLAGQYGTSKALITGEIGRWYGVRVVRTTNPFIENGLGSEGTYVASPLPANAIYRSFLFGDDGFGIPMLAGQSPFNPTVMICDEADKSDPTNKFITAGMKSFWVAVTLNSSWVVSISSKSGYSG
jgi:N4-gp56 family major capsid protein